LVLQEQDNAYLQHVKDVIIKHGIRGDDALRKMGVQRSERATLNVVQVKDALRRLDPVFLNEAKALSAAKAVMRGVEVMTVDRLLEELGALAEELPKAEPPANGTTDG
jgi:hypothetical protein